jgi:hypothetical protein
MTLSIFENEHLFENFVIKIHNGGLMQDGDEKFFFHYYMKIFSEK